MIGTHLDKEAKLYTKEHARMYVRESNMIKRKQLGLLPLSEEDQAIVKQLEDIRLHFQLAES
jgi:hypothetical protein